MPAIAIKDHRLESHLFLGRAVAAGMIAIVLVLILVVRLFALQVAGHDHFTTLSRDNRVKLVPLPPTRGLIYDSRGKLLAQNLPAYSLEITPEKVKDLDATIAALNQIIPISDSDRARFERLRKQSRRFDGIPIRVKLNAAEVALFAVKQHRFPGVDIRATLLRHYPLGAETAHVLGYVGLINEKELNVIDPSEYAGTRYIGKGGIEKAYESLLHGGTGMQEVEVNAKGRTLRVLRSENPQPGQDLQLFLDAELQEDALASFGDFAGALAAVDPKTGGILALVSKPGFDPNLFVEGISSQDYKALQDDPDNPLFNRAVRGQYPPGSTVKPFIGLAALENGVITANEKHFCPGFYQLPGHSHKYRDWKKWGHGSVDMNQAISESCDVYFYDLAHTLGIDTLNRYLSMFSFGRKTGIDLTEERGGLLPSREWKQETRRAPWYPGETLITGIGQGYFLTTPLQLASATAALANNGLYIRPRLVKAIGRADAGGIQETGAESHQIPVKDSDHWHAIFDAMAAVVEAKRGTAATIRSDKYRIAGKTGTAQVFSVAQDEEYDEETIEFRKRDHALFVAFAPIEDPRIAIAVVVEHGGHGSSVAAPIARRVMDRYLLGK